MCAKWRIRLNPEKTKVIIFSKSQTAIRAEPALSLYVVLLSYYPQIKLLGITFDNRMTFTKHFKEILGKCHFLPRGGLWKFLKFCEFLVIPLLYE